MKGKSAQLTPQVVCRQEVLAVVYPPQLPLQSTINKEEPPQLLD